MRLVIRMFLVLLAPLAAAQTYANGNFTFSLSQDVSQSVQYCNPLPCQTLWHSAYVYVTAKNLRTGQVVTQSDTGSHRIVAINAVLPALPGDVVQYTETQTITCPVMGTILNINFTWHVEFASTDSINTGVQSTGTYYDQYNAAPHCSGGAPDYNRTTIQDSHGSNPWGWGYQGVCSSSTGHQPWSCTGGYPSQVRYGQPQPPYPCTSNP